jgi:3-dehydroquinate dehydratase type I
MKACVVIAENNLFKAISIAKRYETAEVRLDLCKFSNHNLKLMFESHPNLIVTHRDNRDLLEKTNAIKLAIESGAAMVDIEYKLDEDCKLEILQTAKTHNCKVIISYHNAELTPSLDELREIITESKKWSPTYIKIVTKTNSKFDALRLLNLYDAYDNVIAFGLGENSKYTRIASVYLGAPFMYIYFGTLKNQIASGQLSAKEFEVLQDKVLAIPSSKTPRRRTQLHH